MRKELNVKRQTLNAKSSFTFIELLVSVSITAIIIIVTLNIYLNLTRSRIEFLASTEIGGEGQQIVNEIIKKIKKCRVAYSLYNDSIPENNVTATLILEDPGETVTSTVTYIYYRRCSPDGSRYVIQKCHRESCNLGEDCQTEDYFKTLTTSDLSIDFLNFRISPRTDPYETGVIPSAHPRVTILMKFHTLREVKGGTELIIQRTAPQRWGGRK